ncbi:hypothetical protein QE152_g1201 [Popillia japonica]|uniref:Uncharacterized protein n=1 Tax=Popillia japonica TaxID=7064 RepID=A0AAW1N382_POPJA
MRKGNILTPTQGPGKKTKEGAGKHITSTSTGSSYAMAVKLQPKDRARRRKKELGNTSPPPLLVAATQWLSRGKELPYCRKRSLRLPSVRTNRQQWKRQL